MSDREYDIVVVGSGGAGLTAALTAAHHGLSVVVVEKAAHYGGSTARSGGGVWIPNNPALVADGVRDTPEAARQYLHSIIGDDTPAELIDTFLARGPEMLSFVLQKTPLKLRWVPNYSDYYPEAPGGRLGGRSVEPAPFNAKPLGAELANLEPPYSKTPLNVVVTQADYRWLNLRKRHIRGPMRAMRVGARLFAARLTGKHLLGMGQALVAALRKGLLDLDVPVLLNTPMIDLHTDDGVVTGVDVLLDGTPTLLRARHGVVLAAGGFERNAEMRHQYQREPIGTEWTVGAAANTGDGIVAGQKLGAATDLMDDAWWGPSIPLPKGPWFCLAERSLPGGIMVNMQGRRFMNEALPYVEAVHRMYGGRNGTGDGPGENIPAWMVMDQRYRDRYMFAGLQPEQRFPKKWVESGVVVQAPTIAELAAKTGLPADELTATIQRFNGFARSGKDEDFGRGDSGYDNYYGDPRNKPNPNLGALEKSPFYAIKMVPGDLGTKGGLRTDASARVLRSDGSVIDGLYAVGNCAIPVMGHTYAGPGATIGPAMTFGYLAALDIAQRATSESNVDSRKNTVSN
ncbi:3-oxosteroid 1-dehydrogenase [Skermania sp. ID1734]|uniref:3-oxosteroid 1-dehydrogenase n=1 Tax=Skermania sp. ID1734 TaxID=2597516 RepID=UPI0011801169|nr:3-oxosteroid 1-dehydrogenase [Skermania sp. ID1734]TSD95655.1 3-oxosteroid 1-dehydrogenase [Skermania sp. ID1734]